MARKTQNSKLKTKDSSEPVARWLWHFVRYAERFGFDPGQFAKAGIEVAKYLRWPLNAWRGEEGEIIQCINRLRAEREFIWLVGAVVELLTVASNTKSAWQGYLFTSRGTPMEASEVGSILRVDGRRALGVLTRLESVGFLERISWSPGPPEGPIVDDPSLRLLQKVAEAKETRDRKRGAKGRFRGENADAPFNKPSKLEEAAAQQIFEGTAGGAGDAAPSVPAKAGQAVCPNCGHTQRVETLEAGAEGYRCGGCSQWLALPKWVNASTISTGLDRGSGGLGSQHHGNPSRQASAPSGSVIQIAEALAGQQHRYSENAQTFARQVLAASGFPPADPLYANELGHFAKAHEAAAAFGDAGLAKFKAKVLAAAGRVGRNRGGYRTPEAYIQTAANNALCDLAHKAKHKGTG